MTMRPLLALWTAGLLGAAMLPALAQTAGPAPTPAAAAAPAPAAAPSPANTTKADRAKLKADQKKRQGDKVAGRTAAKSADKVALQNDRAKVSSDTGGTGTTATGAQKKGKKRP
jgi:hypothetical protein